MSDYERIKYRAQALKRELLSIARDLDTYTSSVRVVKATGTAATILGTGLAILGTVATGGLALPAVAVIGGLGASAAGAAVAIGAEFVGQAITKSKLNDAQKAWDQFCESLPSSGPFNRFSQDEALSAVMQVIKGGGGALAMGGALGVASVLPVVNGVFLGINVLHLLSTLASDVDDGPGALLRKFVERVLDPIITKL